MQKYIVVHFLNHLKRQSLTKIFTFYVGVETFFNENKPFVYGVGAGFLTLFSLGIAVLIGCNRNRKSKWIPPYHINAAKLHILG